MLKKTLHYVDGKLHKIFGCTSILFEVANDFGFECQAPIINYLLKSTDIKIGIIAASKTLEKDVSSFILTSQYSTLYLTVNCAIWKKWDLVVTTETRSNWYLRKTHAVFQAHGIGIGNLPGRPYDVLMLERNLFSSYISVSDAATQNINRHLDQKLYRGDIASLGFPKLDRLINKAYDIEGISKSLGLDQNKKTILVASHWTECSLLRNIGIDIIQELKPLVKYNIIVTGHNMLWNCASSNFDPNLETKLTQAINDSHIRFIKAANSHELLAVSDFLIADYSSISFEFSCLTKPILYFNNTNHKYNDSLLLNKLLQASFPFEKVGEVVKEIRSAENISAEKLNLMEELAAYISKNIGCAGDEVGKYLLEKASDYRNKSTVIKCPPYD